MGPTTKRITNIYDYIYAIWTYDMNIYTHAHAIAVYFLASSFDVPVPAFKVLLQSAMKISIAVKI